MKTFFLIKKNKYFPIKIFIGFFVVITFLFILFFNYFFIKTQSFSKKEISIPNGYSITQVTNLLNKENIIHYPFLVRIFIQIYSLEPKSGTYLLNGDETLFTLLNRLANAQYGDIYRKIVIPEGVSNKQLIEIIKESDLAINKKNLEYLLKENEGYLFPDTYSFLPNANELDVIKEMKSTFLKKIEQAEKNKTINKSRSDIVTMASIIEKEAGNDLKQKQIISGILWKRIEKGIPLQVDAPFLYERGKGSADLSNSDLRKKSPYNTYIYKGLTPTPIGNPGYDSLFAAAHPIESEYFFYLHGFDGNIHYAKTYSEHLKNKHLYIK